LLFLNRIAATIAAAKAHSVIGAGPCERTVSPNVEGRRSRSAAIAEDRRAGEWRGGCSLTAQTLRTGTGVEMADCGNRDKVKRFYGDAADSWVAVEEWMN